MDLWQVDYWARSRSCSFFFAPLTRGNRSGPLSKRKEKKRKARLHPPHSWHTEEPRQPIHRNMTGLWLCSKDIGGLGCTKRDGFQRWRLPAKYRRRQNSQRDRCRVYIHANLHVLFSFLFLFFSKDTHIHALGQAYVHDLTKITQWTSPRGPTMREQREPSIPHRPETEGTRLPESLVHLHLLVSPHDW